MSPNAAGMLAAMFAPRMSRRVATPAGVFLVCAAVYVATLGPRIVGTSDNAHFVYLAQSLLHGQLALVGNRPPGDNDWAHYGGHWYVSFPPFPAVLIAPLVAVWGTRVWDRLFWAILAGLAPALLYVLLRRLREGHAEAEEPPSERSVRDDLLLTALFAFGSVYYYTAVQGTVWFAAHVVACSLLALYVLASLRAERPLLAGTMLGLCFMTRPTTLLLGLFFVQQALWSARRPAAQPTSGVLHFVRGLDYRRAITSLALFAVPLLAVFAVAMWMNVARFGDPFEFGHSYLEIRWRSRIETWGLFNYHYLSRNLAVMLAGLPWLSAHAPYLTISRHGLALWVTTPTLLWVLWPKRSSPTMSALGLSAALVALLDLCYQNSGWIQFGYRFSLDFAVPMFALLALGGRRFGATFYALLVISVAVNLFGAITFDRVPRFYDTDATQKVMFQPD